MAAEKKQTLTPADLAAIGAGLAGHSAGTSEAHSGFSVDGGAGSASSNQRSFRKGRPRSQSAGDSEGTSLLEPTLLGLLRNRDVSIVLNT